MRPSNPEFQTEIQALSQILTEAPIGTTIPYERFNATIGRDVQTVARMSLIHARKRVEAESGVLFGTVFGIGVKRLPTSEAPSVAKEAKRSIGRKARRTIRRLDNISGNADPSTAQRVAACKSQLGAVALAATLNTDKVVAAAEKNDGQPLPVGRVFDLLRG